MEHVEALGGTIESIAAAKAGIIKHGRPVVIGSQQHSEALSVVLDQAASVGSEALYAPEWVSILSFRSASDLHVAGAIAEFLCCT